MPEKRKKFDQEFRAGAVRIVAETQTSSSRAEHSVEIHASASR